MDLGIGDQPVCALQENRAGHGQFAGLEPGGKMGDHGPVERILARIGAAHARELSRAAARPGKAETRRIGRDLGGDQASAEADRVEPARQAHAIALGQAQAEPGLAGGNAQLARAGGEVKAHAAGCEIRRQAAIGGPVHGRRRQVQPALIVAGGEIHAQRVGLQHAFRAVRALADKAPVGRAEPGGERAEAD